MEYLYNTYNYFANILGSVSKPLPPAFSNFEKVHTLQERISGYSSLTKKYGNNIVPVILEPIDDNTPVIKKSRVIVPCRTNMNSLILEIEKMLHDDGMIVKKGIVLVDVNGKKINTVFSIKTIYDEQRKTDGFLYLYYYCYNK